MKELISFGIAFVAVVMIFVGFVSFENYAENNLLKDETGTTVEERWRMAEKDANEYTIYVNGEKKDNNFNISALEHSNYDIEINTNKKEIIINKKQVNRSDTTIYP